MNKAYRIFPFRHYFAGPLTQVDNFSNSLNLNLHQFYLNSFNTPVVKFDRHCFQRMGNGAYGDVESEYFSNCPLGPRCEITVKLGCICPY